MPKTTITMNFIRTTPGKHLYATADPDAAVENIYIKRGRGIDKDNPPASVIVTVEHTGRGEDKA